MPLTLKRHRLVLVLIAAVLLAVALLVFAISMSHLGHQFISTSKLLPDIMYGG